MEIDLDLYRIFVSVASNGSVSKAAEELSVTQSAVSQRILKLENIFGKELFIRGQRGLKLSAFGEKLYEACKFPVRELEKVLDIVTDKLSEKKVLKIGASDTILQNVVLPIIKNKLPNEEFIFESLMTDKEKIAAVENGSLDFAVINDYNIPHSDNVYKRPLCELEYGFFYNPQLLKIDEENIYSQTLLLKNSRTKGRTEFNKKFFELAYKFDKISEFSHDETIIEAVKLGLGIGFCPKMYVKDKGLEEIELSKEKYIKQVVLIFQQNSEIIQTFIGAVNENR